MEPKPIPAKRYDRNAGTEPPPEQTHEQTHEQPHEHAVALDPSFSRSPPADRTTYLFAIGFGPIGSNELPLPQVSIVDSTLVTARLSELRTQPRAILSRKELQVALMLAAGRSRPAVATELGLSANTVGTYTRRIYSKLCVRNRAEFTARMKSA